VESFSNIKMMTYPTVPLQFDLLKVGSCSHPECVAMRGGSFRSIEFPALVALIDHPEQGLMLYDTGYSEHFFEATRSFPEAFYRKVTPVSFPLEECLLKQLDDRGVQPKDIETILISHFHADHISGLRNFPDAKLIATQAEQSACEKLGRLGRLRKAYLQDLLPDDFEERVTYVESLPKVPEALERIGFEEVYDLWGDQSMYAVNLPGHVESQLGLIFQSSRLGPVFLVADACWKTEGLAENRPPSRLAYSLFAENEDYNQTFTALRNLQEEFCIIPSHCLTTFAKLGGTQEVNRQLYPQFV